MRGIAIFGENGDELVRVVESLRRHRAPPTAKVVSDGQAYAAWTAPKEQAPLDSFTFPTALLGESERLDRKLNGSQSVGRIGGSSAANALVVARGRNPATFAVGRGEAPQWGAF